MARSRRKHPYMGMCAKTEKAFKRQENRAKRRATNVRVERGEEPPHDKEYGNPWSGPKDGRIIIDPKDPGSWKDMGK